MQELVTTCLEGQILVVTIDNPPVNALSVAVRRGLVDALDWNPDDAVAAVVIQGRGRHFIAGADIHEFGKPPQEPYLSDVCHLIENCNKPVVTALHGSVLGGGLEVAMAAHYRIAAPDARLGLPEIKLGLMPGGGGTQRAPRLLGAKDALDLMLSGRPVDGSKALNIGLVDKLVSNGDLEAQALGYANELQAAGTGSRRTCDADGLNDVPKSREAVNLAREAQKKKASFLFSPHCIIDAVEAALDKSFEQGLLTERRLFSECKKSPQCSGLIHAFFAEREAGKVPESTAAEPRGLQQVGVVGGGTMGAGITVACLKAGFPVTMVERDAESCDRGRLNVEKIIHGWLAKGRIGQTEHDWLLSQYSVNTDYSSLNQADLVVEAAFEDMAVKQGIFSELDRVCKPGAVLSSNTSYLDINVIAQRTARPGRVIGLHFFSPAHVMKLLEVVVAKQADADVIATGFALAKRLGKVAVRAGVCDGFIGNRMLATYRQVAYRLVEYGATPYEIDEAVRDFGYPIGPFQMFDMAGGDIGWAMRKRRAPDRDPRDRYVEIPDRLCERGWFGQKTGRGWYRYPSGSRKGEQDPDVLTIINQERHRVGVTPRQIGKKEILTRYLTAMINVGADVVNEGIALRPLDVDTVLVHGYGFPRHRGGPMHYADQVGLRNILADIQHFSEEDPRFWQPSPLLERLVAENRDFVSLNHL